MKPVLQALVLAERVWQTHDGRHIIAGTFHGVTLKEQPSRDPNAEVQIVHGGRPGAPYAYISLTDVVDGTEILLQFVNLNKNEVLFEKDIKIDSKDRLTTIEIVAALPDLPIREAGVYAFEVVCEGEVLGSSRVNAKLLED